MAFYCIYLQFRFKFYEIELKLETILSTCHRPSFCTLVSIALAQLLYFVKFTMLLRSLTKRTFCLKDAGEKSTDCSKNRKEDGKTEQNGGLPSTTDKFTCWQSNTWLLQNIVYTYFPISILALGIESHLQFSTRCTLCAIYTYVYVHTYAYK